MPQVINMSWYRYNNIIIIIIIIIITIIIIVTNAIILEFSPARLIHLSPPQLTILSFF